MTMSNSSARNLVNGLQDMMKDAVESYMDDFDFDDAIGNAMPDIDEKVTEAIDDADINKLVQDEVDNVDFNELIENALSDVNFEEKVSEAVANVNIGDIVERKVNTYLDSDKFKDKLIELQTNNLKKIISNFLWSPITYSKKVWNNFCFELYVVYIEICHAIKQLRK